MWFARLRNVEPETKSKPKGRSNQMHRLVTAAQMDTDETQIKQGLDRTDDLIRRSAKSNRIVYLIRVNPCPSVAQSNCPFYFASGFIVIGSRSGSSAKRSPASDLMSAG